MICFQYFIFDIPLTTNRARGQGLYLLWFAFNILSLTYRSQHKRVHSWRSPVVICFQYFIFDIPLTTWSADRYFDTCCDLLSIFYLWHTAHNLISNGSAGWALWFAFNILSLTYRSQLTECCHNAYTSCDLLSIFYLWHTAHNSIKL